MKYQLICTLFFASASCLAQSGQNKVAEGNKAYEHKKYTEAEKNYKAAIDAKKDNFIANFNLGDALYQQKKYEEAARQYQQAQNLKAAKGENESVLYNMGNALLKKNKLDESIEAYKKALKANPEDLDAKYNLSYALAKRKQQEKEKQKDNNNKDKKDQRDQQAKKNNGGQTPQPSNPNGNGDATPDKQGEISRAEAERILNALKNDEQETRQRMYKNGPEDKEEKNKNSKPW